jgi:hypothetical protein
MSDEAVPETIDIMAPDDEETRAFGDFFRKGQVSTKILGDNLQKFVAGLGAALANIPQALPQHRLDEIEVSVSISAEGGVSLLGTGGKAGAEGGLKLTFKRGR